MKNITNQKIKLANKEIWKFYKYINKNKEALEKIELDIDIDKKLKLADEKYPLLKNGLLEVKNFMEKLNKDIQKTIEENLEDLRYNVVSTNEKININYTADSFSLHDWTVYIYNEPLETLINFIGFNLYETQIQKFIQFLQIEKNELSLEDYYNEDISLELDYIIYNLVNDMVDRLDPIIKTYNTIKEMERNQNELFKKYLYDRVNHELEIIRCII